MSNRSVKLTLTKAELQAAKELAGREPLASFLKRQAFSRITLPIEAEPVKAPERIDEMIKETITQSRNAFTVDLPQMDKDQQQAQTAMHQIKDSAKKRGKHFTDTW